MQLSNYQARSPLFKQRDQNQKSIEIVRLILVLYGREFKLRSYIP